MTIFSKTFFLFAAILSKGRRKLQQRDGKIAISYISNSLINIQERFQLLATQTQLLFHRSFDKNRNNSLLMSNRYPHRRLQQLRLPVGLGRQGEISPLL